MANVILPFVVSCGTPNDPATNLVTADNGLFTKEKDSGIASKRQKPLQLFVEIMRKYTPRIGLFTLLMLAVVLALVRWHV